MSGVVVHLAEAGAQRRSAILRTVLNLRADLGPDVPVELVAHGPGVALLTGSQDHRRGWLSSSASVCDGSAASTPWPAVG